MGGNVARGKCRFQFAISYKEARASGSRAGPARAGPKKNRPGPARAGKNRPVPIARRGTARARGGWGRKDRRRVRPGPSARLAVSFTPLLGQEESFWLGIGAGWGLLSSQQAKLVKGRKGFLADSKLKGEKKFWALRTDLLSLSHV